MKFKLEDFKIGSITELSNVVGGAAANVGTGSYHTDSNYGCDDDWDWDDTTSLA